MNYKSIYTDFEYYLKSLSQSEHSWFMSEEEFYDFSHVVVTIDHKPTVLESAYYDRGNESVVIETSDDVIFWHNIPKDVQETILNVFYVNEYGKISPITIQEAQDAVYRKLCYLFDNSVATQLSENLAERVQHDVLETADGAYNDSDIIIAIGRVLLDITQPK